MLNRIRATPQRVLPAYTNWVATRQCVRYNSGGPIALQLNDVSKTWEDDGRTLFKGVNIHFFDGAKIGVLGANGAGKSSLLKIIAGMDTEFDGEMKIREGYKVGYLQQEPELNEEKTVLGNIMEGIQDKLDLVDEFNAISEKFADPDADFDALIARQGEVQGLIDTYQCWDLTYKVREASEALRCPPDDYPVTSLSGGERRRIALCRLLLSDPDLLLLDEPTNHLDATSVKWLENYLESYRGLVIGITHDRYFLDNVAQYILEISEGRFYAYDGNYSTYLETKQKRAELAGKQMEKASKAMSRELAWLRQNSGMRSNEKRKQTFQQAQDAEEERRRAIIEEGGALVLPEGPRMREGNILSVRNLKVEFDGRVLFESLNFNLASGDILGIVGPNGAGKSTLFRVIRGLLQPQEGEVKIAENVKMAFNAQTREFNPDRRVWNEIADGRTEIMMDTQTGWTMAARAYVAQFNFIGKSQQKTMGMLSGGERNRVHLAKSLSYGCNLLLLDEPTNDLDVNTLRSLEEGLVTFKGATIVISHDRWFLDKVATKVMVYEGDKVNMYDGNYSMYLEYHRRNKKK